VEVGAELARRSLPPPPNPITGRLLTGVIFCAKNSSVPGEQGSNRVILIEWQKAAGLRLLGFAVAALDPHRPDPGESLTYL